MMPCLNEADTLERCILTARAALSEAGIDGEVVVADNGSTDGSVAIAEASRARVVRVAARGYGSALAGGIGAARGRYVVMGDADASYDFAEIPRFVARLREGYDLVQGCRLAAGGGTILPGAMPALHRLFGNPIFSLLARGMFRAPIHDVYCGLRAFRRDFQIGLGQRCTGMEFATEMIIKASLSGGKLAEVPITLHPDGRVAHAPHLRTFRDGWRTLRFFLMSSPRWLFLVPGLGLAAAGAVVFALGLAGVRLLGARLDAHSLLVGALGILLGFNVVVFALCAKVFGVAEGFLPPDPRLDAFFERARLEHGLLLGTASFVAGVSLIALAALGWWRVGFGDLDYQRTMRLVVPGTLFAALGFQMVLASFLVSLLGVARR